MPFTNILSQRVSESLKGDLAYERNHELDEERVKLQTLSYMQKNTKMHRAEIIQMTGWDKNKVYRFMKKLREEGLVINKGRGSGAHYVLNEDE
ncbi:winged helix-turn-helix transcriptional regulator [Sporosarcina gallistercoris]|uniref:winged helix-turn-helix transcriptional regulator n=1 Tax=Sporosarcina gallistercoris TaxID=2762245 RepID=UPI003D2E766E